MNIEKELINKGYCPDPEMGSGWYYDPSKNIHFEVGPFWKFPLHIFHFERVGSERGHGRKVIEDLLSIYEPVTACTAGIIYYEKYFDVEISGIFSIIRRK